MIARLIHFAMAKATPIIMKVVRYGLTAAGAYLTQHHLVSNSDLYNELVGGLLASVGIIWSLVTEYIDHRDGYVAAPPADVGLKPGDNGGNFQGGNDPRLP